MESANLLVVGVATLAVLGAAGAVWGFLARARARSREINAQIEALDCRLDELCERLAAQIDEVRQEVRRLELAQRIETAAEEVRESAELGALPTEASDRLQEHLAALHRDLLAGDGEG